MCPLCSETGSGYFSNTSGACLAPITNCTWHDPTSVSGGVICEVCDSGYSLIADSTECVSDITGCDV